MRTPTLSALCLALLAQAGAAHAADAPCRARPDRVGACYAVQGDLRLFDGTPSARIDVAHSRRVLGVASYTEADDETFAAPEALRRRASFDHPVAGRFLVCPLSRPRPAQMRTVCVERFGAARR